AGPGSERRDLSSGGFRLASVALGFDLDAADVLSALDGSAGWIFAGAERVQRLRAGPQWQSRVLPCACRRPDVRATQAAGIVGTRGGIAPAGSPDVSRSG